MRPNLPALKDAQHKIYYFTKDIKINGITVGRGAGNISLNTAVGASALSNNTTGSNNTAFGYAAGNTITSGSYNTFIGYNARGSAGTNIYELAIGHGALGLGSNTTVIGTNGATNSTTIYGALSLPDTTASTSTITGALKVSGGAGVAGWGDGDGRPAGPVAPWCGWGGTGVCPDCRLRHGEDLSRRG